MRTLPMPELIDELDFEEFWTSDRVATTKYAYEMLEEFDKLLEPYGLEVGEYDAGMSEHVFTVLERK